jgi:hypothetical protein
VIPHDLQAAIVANQTGRPTAAEEATAAARKLLELARAEDASNPGFQVVFRLLAAGADKREFRQIAKFAESEGEE